MSNDFTPTLAGTIAAMPVTSPAAAVGTRLRIVHVGGSLSGRTQELEPGSITVGRHPESQIRYDHTIDFLVSTRHGQLTFDVGRWWFVDGNSTNGTYVNNSRVQRQALSSGMTISLGMTGAPGSAAFRVEFDGGATAAEGPVDPNVPFAQEPPALDDHLHKSPAGVAAAPVPYPPVPGAHAPVAASAPPAVVAAPPVSAQPQPTHRAAAPAAPNQEQGFFGGLIGGIKNKMDRRRERKELQRELASLEQQIPQLETDLRQASIGLGHELWRIGKERFAAFRATPRLNDIDAAVSQLEAKQSDVDRTFGERNDQYQQWLAGWQEEAARRDAELNAANQAVAESLAELAKAKEEVIAALASRAESLTIAAQRATELAAEARTEPKDDFWERFGAFLEDVEAQSKQLKVPIPELADRIAARAAAQQSLAAAIGRQAEAAARVQESKKERAEKDGAHGEVQRVYQQAQAAHRAEVDKIRSQAPPQHADLGRQYIETPDAPQFTPAPPPLASARAALDRLTQTRSSIAQKRQRLAELEAS